MTFPIGILMATCNGAAHLPAQLDSIAAQTFTDWHLHVRDDASTDGTVALLDAFAQAHPGRVTRHRDGLGRLGARENFARLMRLAPEPYVAFCDQDDVWRPAKLARSLARLRALEAGAVPGTPAMVHADRRVVDAAGAELSPSYWRSRQIVPQDMSPGAHLTFCVAAGSTMLINRALLERALPVPQDARMHDTWLELVAHFTGVVSAMDEVVLDWRRHGANTSGGATDNTTAAARRPLARASRLFGNLGRQREIYAQFLRQAAAFEAAFGKTLGARQARALRRFLTLPRASLIRRAWLLWRSGAVPPGPARTLALVALSGGAAATLPRPAGWALGRDPA